MHDKETRIGFGVVTFILQIVAAILIAVLIGYSELTQDGKMACGLVALILIVGTGGMQVAAWCCGKFDAR